MAQSNSNPPSSRPMTLRQQLDTEIHDLRVAIASFVPDTGTNRYDHLVRLNKLITLEIQKASQEVAREAVHDKIKSLAQAGNEFGLKNGSVEAGWAHIRDLIQAELTQKPPQPQRADSHTDIGGTVGGNEADNLLVARINERSQTKRMMRETTVSGIPYYLMEKSWWDRRGVTLRERLRDERQI